MQKVKSTVKGFFTSKQYRMASMLSLAMALLCVGAFATDGDPVNYLDMSTLVTSMSGMVSTSQILGLIGSIVGAGFGFALVWFGARKVIRAFMSAIKGGKIKV